MSKIRSKHALLDKALSLAFFRPFRGHGVAIPTHRVDRNSRLVVCVGDNASGKSVFRRIVSQLCQRDKIEPIRISMEGRTTSTMFGMVYGDEGWESTGVCSARTVLKGIETCRSRNRRHIMFWDEPDLGLSDVWAAAMGRSICEFVQSMPKKTVATFVVTHSKALVRQLLPARPTALFFGEVKYNSLEDWIAQEPPPCDLQELMGVGRHRFLKIQTLMDTLKKEQELEG